MRLIDADKLLQDIKHYNLSDGKFQHWVEIQPTVELEPHWSPCSERPPEVNDTYIVTCIDKNVNMKWTDVAEYSKRHSGWRCGLRSSDDIIAWMPLPEPYQPKEDES